MDVRMGIIQKVVMALTGKAEDETINKVQKINLLFISIK